MGGLNEVLAAEAAARLKDPETITLEAVKAAAEAKGVTFTGGQQVLGRTMLALYCANFDSADGLTVTICEYPTAEQAKRGEAETNLIQQTTAGHQSHLRGKSVLHLIVRSTVPKASLDAVLAAFKGP